MNADVILERARLLLQQHRHEQAAEQLKYLLANEPNIGEAHALLALCWLENRDLWHDATREAQQAIHLEPDNPMAHYVLACVFDKRERLNEAKEAILEAIRLDPGQPSFHAMHASLLSQSHQWQASLDAANIGLMLDPENVACANLRSFALERLGKTQDALAESEKAVSRAPDSGHAHAMRGWALLNSGMYREAQEAFREALRLQPTNEFARTGMMQALNSNNFLFRMMFRFYSFASRLGATSQWILVFGLFFGNRFLQAFANANPEWQPFVLPITIIYLLFCMLSWIVNPIFNAFLRIHPFGKYLLSSKEKWASTIVGILLVTAVIIGVVFAAMGDWFGAIVLGTIPIYLTIPVTIAFNVDRGWPQWIAIPIAGIMAMLGFAATLFYATDTQSWGGLFLLFSYGILVVSIAGSYLMRVTVKH